MRRLFLDHPRSIGETYGEHLRQAAGFGGLMVWGGLACLIHALLPFLFERTASRCVSELHGRMSGRRPGAAIETKRVANA